MADWHLRNSKIARISVRDSSFFSSVFSGFWTFRVRKVEMGCFNCDLLGFYWSHSFKNRHSINRLASGTIERTHRNNFSIGCDKLYLFLLESQSFGRFNHSFSAFKIWLLSRPKHWKVKHENGQNYPIFPPRYPTMCHATGRSHPQLPSTFSFYLYYPFSNVQISFGLWILYLLFSRRFAKRNERLLYFSQLKWQRLELAFQRELFDFVNDYLLCTTQCPVFVLRAVNLNKTIRFSALLLLLFWGVICKAWEHFCYKHQSIWKHFGSFV